MKNLTFDGRLGADAEVKTTKSGKRYVKFSVANNTYSSGDTKTEWFDVTSFDPFVIEKRLNQLKKGRYVIVTGQLDVEANVDENRKLWLNQYVTANSIETPSFGGAKRDESPAEEVPSDLSTYTGGTLSSAVGMSAADNSYGSENFVSPYDDDLPF